MFVLVSGTKLFQPFNLFCGNSRVNLIESHNRLPEVSQFLISVYVLATLAVTHHAKRPAGLLSSPAAPVSSKLQSPRRAAAKQSQQTSAGRSRSRRTTLLPSGGLRRAPRPDRAPRRRARASSLDGRPVSTRRRLARPAPSERRFHACAARRHKPSRRRCQPPPAQAPPSRRRSAGAAPAA